MKALPPAPALPVRPSLSTEGAAAGEVEGRRAALRSAGTVSGGTLLSRCLGLLRDTVLAHVLGAGAAADAFAVAFRVPNLLREIVGEGALTSAFLPCYAARRAGGDPEGARRLFRSAFTLLVSALAVLTLAVVGLLLLVPPGALHADDPDKAALVLRLTTWCFPYALLVCGAALFAAVLQAEGRFGIPALAPAVMNVAWVAAIFLLLPLFPPTMEGRATAVAAAVLVGGTAQAAVSLPLLRRLRLLPRPSVAFGDPALRTMLRRMLPAVIGLAPVQVNLLVNALLAEAFVPGDGANSALYYSGRLLQLPLALVGISLGVASFPLFSRLAAEGRKGDLGRAVSGALRTVLFLSLPAAAGLAVLALPAATALFRHGRFTLEDAGAAAGVLRCALVGLPAFCALQVMTRAFHASGDTATPVRVGAWSVALNFAGNLALVGPMGARGLALSTAVVAWVNLAALLWLARHRMRLRGLRAAGGTLVRGGGLALLAAGAAAGASAGAASLIPGPGTVAALAAAGAGALAGAAAFGIPALLLDAPEARDLREAVAGRRPG